MITLWRQNASQIASEAMASESGIYFLREPNEVDNIKKFNFSVEIYQGRGTSNVIVARMKIP